MGTRPWGPHGPEVPANTVTPNPTAASGAAPAFDAAAYPAAPMPSGDGVAGGFLANIICSLVLVGLVWEAAACLYPITVIAAIAAWRVTEPMVNLVAPAAFEGDLGYLMGFFASLLALGVVIRLEYRLAQNPAFRMARHIVRMVLLSLWAIPIVMLCMRVPYSQSSTTLFIYSVVTDPPTMLQFLSDPTNLAIWGAFVTGLHFMIWNWAWARLFWHRRLKMIGLK